MHRNKVGDTHTKKVGELLTFIYGNNILDEKILSFVH